MNTMSVARKSNSMNEDVEYVGGLIKRVGNLEPTAFKSDIEERKQFQKTVYLIQAFDINLGYEFNWYIHGPYCPPLADVGYSLADCYDSIDEREFAEETWEEHFQTFLRYIDPLKEETERLEIAASLHYLWVRNEEKPRDLLIEWLLTEKDLSRGFDECEEEWRRLSEFDVIEE